MKKGLAMAEKGFFVIIEIDEDADPFPLTY